MENWGAITFRTNCLERLDGDTFQKYFSDCRLVCHEIAHMWFGNLVTLAWWNDVWLNEGFATYMEFRSLNAVRNQFRPWLKFVAQVCYQVLQIDIPFAKSHPIEIPYINPSLISSYFDGISYRKGASVLRMIESYIGQESFDQAIRQYLDNFKGGSVTTKDFFQVIKSYSASPMQEILETWTQQSGFPLVTVSKINSNRFRVVQSPYDRFGQGLWKIPLGFITDTDEVGSILLEEVEGVIETKGEAKWVKINHNSTGFYRVLYEDYAEIFEDIRKMNVYDRYGIANDVIANFTNGLIEFTQVMHMINEIIPEYEYEIIALICTFFTRNITTKTISDYLIPVLYKLLFPLWEKHGLQDQPEDLDFPALRELFLSYLMYYCRNEIVAERLLLEIQTNQRFVELEDYCLLCMSFSQITNDRIDSNGNFRLFMLKSSNEVHALRLAVKQEVNGEQDDHRISYSIDYRAKTCNNILLEALVLEYIECLEEQKKQIIGKYVQQCCKSIKYFENDVEKFISSCIEGLDSERQEKKLLQDCVLELREKETYAGFNKILSYFTNH